jgi:hypothetical protein
LTLVSTKKTSAATENVFESRSLTSRARESYVADGSVRNALLVRLVTGVVVCGEHRRFGSVGERDVVERQKPFLKTDLPISRVTAA